MHSIIHGLKAREIPMILRKELGLNLRNTLIVLLSLTSLSFFNGLAGCDNGETVEDTASSAEGDPVDLGESTPPGEAPVEAEPPIVDDTPPLPPPTAPSRSAKNVILMIGSGMGPQQIGQVVQYRRLRQPFEEKLALERLMAMTYLGMVTTHSYLDIVSDTSAANSAIACGHKVRNNTLALNANGNPCKTVLEKAMDMGKATGLVSNHRLSHPGIAAFAAHHLVRQEENAIAENLIQTNEVDVLLAGGLGHLIPQYKDEAMTPMRMSDVEGCSGVDPKLDGMSYREDQTSLIKVATDKGYQFVCNTTQLNEAAPTAEGKLLGLFANSRFPYASDRGEVTGLPTLSALTERALVHLSAKEEGFLLVVHGGLSNLAARDNDPGTLLQEGLAFDKAVKAALDYVEGNPDTLLLVTADHETGGFGFAYSNQRAGSLDLPSGDHYEPPYNYAPFLRMDLLEAQGKSFYGLTTDLLERVYGDDPDLTLDSASAELALEVESNTPYRLTIDQAREVLRRNPGMDNAQTKDFSEFYVHKNVHANLLGRAVSRQTSTIWGAGTPTSTPVLIMAAGPMEHASRVRGFMDNTQISEIILDALMGR